MNKHKHVSKFELISDEPRYAMKPDGGCEYEEICQIMEACGHKMTRSTARNRVINAGVVVLQKIRQMHGLPELPRQAAIEASLSPAFQHALGGMIQKIDARRARR